MSARIPARYDRHPADLFAAAVAAQLRPGLDILDVGSGRRPALEPAARPSGSRYAGLDLSAAELERAPAGSYTDVVVSDITVRVPALEGGFDLVLSWQVLEHVRHLDRALENLHAYLRPGGRMIAVLSGRFSAFGLLNAVLPGKLGAALMRRLLRRDPETVFPAYYDGCYAGALSGLLARWSSAAITPLFQGGSYFNFSPRLRAAYFVYEDWACGSGRANLATHYLIVARR